MDEFRTDCINILLNFTSIHLKLKLVFAVLRQLIATKKFLTLYVLMVFHILLINMKTIRTFCLFWKIEDASFGAFNVRFFFATISAASSLSFRLSVTIDFGYWFSLPPFLSDRAFEWMRFHETMDGCVLCVLDVVLSENVLHVILNIKK